MKDDGYKIRDQYAVHFITFAVVEWIDVFTHLQVAGSASHTTVCTGLPETTSGQAKYSGSLSCGDTFE